MIAFTEYIGFFNFSTFQPLIGRSKWSNLLNILNYFRLFDFLLGGQNDWFYWIYWIFSTFRPLAGRSTERFLLDILNSFDFSTFRTLVGRSKWLILLTIFNFLDISTLRHLGGRSKWLILLNILFFFTFRLFDLLPEGQNDWFYWIYLIF